MELPPIITPPPVPIPERVAIKAFHKSAIILIIAYIQMVVYAFSFLMPLIFRGGLGGFTSIIFIIPALIVVFTKSESSYKIARIFLIIECVLLIFPIILFLIFISNF